MAFLPEYAACLMNRLKKGEDGKVAYERSRGKKPTVLGIEFGEKLLFRLAKGPKMEKIKLRWEYCIFVGAKRESGEVMVATLDGVYTVRSVRRIPAEQRCVWIVSIG